MDHHYERQSARGFGSWQQCRRCGATIHSGHYWYAGSKSKTEPACGMLVGSPEYQQWLATATKEPYPQ